MLLSIALLMAFIVTAFLSTKFDSRLQRDTALAVASFYIILAAFALVPVAFSLLGIKFGILMSVLAGVTLGIGFWNHIRVASIGWWRTYVLWRKMNRIKTISTIEVL